MLFDSLDFALFLPIVLTIYWLFNKSLKAQNIIIVCASYIFYGCWDWRFLWVILFTTLVDYLVGLKLTATKSGVKRKSLLLFSLLTNIGFLFFFKYFNFFIDEFVTSFEFFGRTIEKSTLHIIVPIGISFYTFQTMSYTIDIYKKEIVPTKNIIAFTAFVSFFPQLIAGPIERASNLLPQFLNQRSFNRENVLHGLRQILWGLFKKMVIADNIGEFVNQILDNANQESGSSIALSIALYHIQVYADFSGYSDIAIGTARLFGFDLVQNFSFPLFARDISDYWRRWHISFSNWLRDYIYFPLGGSRGTILFQLRNLFITFIVSGLWHNLSLNFLIWGLLNATYFIPVVIKNRKRKKQPDYSKSSMSFRISSDIFVTFILVIFTRFFYKAETFDQSLFWLEKVFSTSFFHFPQSPKIVLIIFIISFLVIEWFGRNQKYALENLTFLRTRSLRHIFYYALIFLVFYYSGETQNFIYFQF